METSSSKDLILKILQSTTCLLSMTVFELNCIVSIFIRCCFLSVSADKRWSLEIKHYKITLIHYCALELTLFLTYCNSILRSLWELIIFLLIVVVLGNIFQSYVCWMSSKCTLQIQTNRKFIDIKTNMKRMKGRRIWNAGYCSTGGMNMTL